MEQTIENRASGADASLLDSAAAPDAQLRCRRYFGRLTCQRMAALLVGEDG